MDILKFSFSEKVAVTLDNGVIEIWTPVEYSGEKRTKLFSKSIGKCILSSDSGYTWKYYSMDAPYCEYYEYWMGEYPYSSWAWAIRKCKVTGEVIVESIETEINPRGETQQDRWRRECLSYVPVSIEIAS